MPTSILKVYLPFFISFFVLSGCGQNSPDTQGSSQEKKGAKGGRSITLAYYVVRDSKLEHEHRGSATLLSDEEIEFKAEISARIKEIPFTEGQKISKGAILFILEDAEIQAQKLKAKARVEMASLTESRKKNQFQLEAISQQDYDQCKLELLNAQADLALLEAQLKKYVVTAPFSGIAGLRTVSLGQYVQIGQKLSTLTSDKAPKVEFAIPEGIASSLRKGEKIRLTSSNQAKPLEASIYAWDSRLDPASRNLLVRARLDNFTPGLYPGAVLLVTWKTSSRSGLLIPSPALTGNARGSVVYILKDGKATASPVRIGSRTPEAVEIIEGLAIGDTALVPGGAALRPNAVVKLGRELTNGTH